MGMTKYRITGGLTLGTEHPVYKYRRLSGRMEYVATEPGGTPLLAPVYMDTGEVRIQMETPEGWVDVDVLEVSE